MTAAVRGSAAIACAVVASHAAIAAPSMPGMDHGAMEAHGADARDADDPRDANRVGMDMADDTSRLFVLVDRLEVVAHDARGQALDAQAWYGGDLDKLWAKVDGSRADGRLDATRTEAVWSHAIASYWDLQAGVRQDVGAGPGRSWAGLGVQGLAPYRFDVQASAYLGTHGRTAARFEVEYDLLVTQRVVLQPDLKVDVFGRDDASRAIGAGLSRIEAALRLRYEITRGVAPYVGVAWTGRFGNTARFVRAAGDRVRSFDAVAGFRLRF